MTSWVVGSRGLLGSAVTRELERRGEPVMAPATVAWGTADAVPALRAGLAHLIEAAADRPWTIYWCAGVGVTHTAPSALAAEAETFEGFVAAMAALPRGIRERGLVVFSSSAGGLYGGSSGAPFTEDSEIAPLGAYGAAKRAAEVALERLSHDSGVRVFVGRIANLYGPGQDLSKQQGLITRMCLSALTRTPVSVFVSLDTRRDYVFVGDGAALLVDCAERAHDATDRFHLKIIGSGRSTTIASILGQFRTLGGAVPRVITGSSPAASLQARDLRLRSEVWRDLDARPVTPLADGIARTMRDLQQRWLQAGRLAP